MRYFVKYSRNNPSGWPVCDSNLPVKNGKVVCRAVSRVDAEKIRDALNVKVSKITIDNIGSLKLLADLDYIMSTPQEHEVRMEEIRRIVREWRQLQASR